MQGHLDRRLQVLGRLLLIPSLATLVLCWLASNSKCLGEENMPNDSYFEQITNWRKLHEEKFKSPMGWLALIGHHWLKEGENSFGADPNCEIRLPPELNLKSRGSFRVADGSVNLYIDAPETVLVNGHAITHATLQIDMLRPESDGTDKINLDDRLSMQLVRRSSRLAVRVRNSQSKSIAEFKGKRWYAVDPKYCIDATFKPYSQPKPIEIVNIKGETVESMVSGSIEFTLEQRTFTLDAISDAPNELFVLFKDLTSGKSTYGPGRFLDIESSKSGKLKLDFNKAYSPPCAYSPHTLCPLPPRQNHLNIAIEAGEQLADSAVVLP